MTFDGYVFDFASTVEFYLGAMILGLLVGVVLGALQPGRRGG